MRVFVTGAAGFVGSAVVPELIGAGHHVVGLARSDANADALAAAGAEIHRGSLQDLDSLREGAAKSDGVIHLAFIHDFSQYETSLGIDLRAIEAMGAALEGTDRPFLVASGMATAAAGRVATERDAPAPGFPRSEAALMTISMAERGVRSSVVRLPPSVHSDADKHGFIRILIGVAREKGVSAYIGDGTNCWPAAHQLDAALLFRLGLEKAPAGSILHTVGDEGVPTRAIAEVIGRHLDLRVVSVSPDAAADHFGWIGMIFGFDIRASAALTQEQLDWKPTHIGLIEDMEQGHYFLD